MRTGTITNGAGHVECVSPEKATGGGAKLNKGSIMESLPTKSYSTTDATNGDTATGWRVLSSDVTAASTGTVYVICVS